MDLVLDLRYFSTYSLDVGPRLWPGMNSMSRKVLRPWFWPLDVGLVYGIVNSWPVFLNMIVRARPSKCNKDFTTIRDPHKFHNWDIASSSKQTTSAQDQSISTMIQTMEVKMLHSLTTFSSNPDLRWFQPFVQSSSEFAANSDYNTDATERTVNEHLKDFGNLDIRCPSARCNEQ